MGIELYDTLSRSYRPLVPHQGTVFRFYCCGPTVYGPAHIGNFRSFLLQDVLRRLLEQSGQATYHLRNITDVDDKTIRQSQAEKLSLKAFTEKWTERFHADCRTLNLLPPHVEPKATEHIKEQIELIQKLLDHNFAYRAQDGSVYFRVKSFKGYGKLSQLDPEKLQTQAVSSSGSSNLADEYSRDCIHDFALWKAYKAEDGPNFWESPWGKGRPGWHIECSAMALRYLGPSFDLHAGGIDLCFPHHENEIAQSECASGEPLSHHWLHNAHLLVNDSKMSKSLGNLYTLSDIQAEGFSPMALRYSLIAGHYKQPLNFTFQSLHAAESALAKLEKAVLSLAQKAELSLQELGTLFKHPCPQDPWEPFEGFYQALCKDLNTPAALGALFKQMPQLASLKLPPLAVLKALAKVAFSLGLAWDFSKNDKQTQSQLRSLDPSALSEVPAPSEAILDLAHKRQAAKLAKDYLLADSYRDALASQGWAVIDTPGSFTLKPKS
jgi:cysteinyl-tRNA synthetase